MSATSGEPGEHCSVSLELPPQPDSDLPYTAAGIRDVVSIDELAAIVLAHFEHPYTN